jgi:undecaprenyl-diphosphatase
MGMIVLCALASAPDASCDGPHPRLALPWEWEASEADTEEEWGVPGRPIPLTGMEELLPRGETLLLPPDLPTSQSRRLFTREELRWLGMGAALLLPSDARTIHFFDPDLHLHPSGDGEGRFLSKLGTGLPMAIAILTPSLVDGKPGRQATRLTAMAVLNATLLTEGVKFLVGKERPDESGGAIRFHGPGSGYTSFPSGHTAASFAAATVLGHRYPKYKLVFYLLAAGVGAARINAARHFPSDVFVGATIGIYSGRLVLRRGGKLHLWR